MKGGRKYNKMSAKKVAMNSEKCSCSYNRWLGWLTLVVGVLYLLQDLSVISFWGWLNGWTALFILVGLAVVCKCCDQCKM